MPAKTYRVASFARGVTVDGYAVRREGPGGTGYGGGCGADGLTHGVALFLPLVGGGCWWWWAAGGLLALPTPKSYPGGPDAVKRRKRGFPGGPAQTRISAYTSYRGLPSETVLPLETVQI